MLRGPRRMRLLLLAPLLSGACSGGAATDGGLPDAVVDGYVFPAAAPEPPAPPEMPCPAGWREVDGPDVPRHCEPYPEEGAATCAEGEAHFPGEPGCASIGEPCPPGDYSGALPSDAPVVYALSGAVAGDGSVGAPFGTLGEAIAAAVAGATIAVGSGLYDEQVEMPGEVSLHGACVTETVLTWSTAGIIVDPVVSVHAPGVGIRDLSIADARGTAISVSGAGAQLVLDGVLLSRDEVQSILVSDGGSVTATTLVVRDTQPSSSTRELGRAATATAGSRLHITRAFVSGSRERALLALGEGTSLVLEDAVVRDTDSSETDGMFGLGVSVNSGADAQLTRVAIERSRQAGLFVTGGSTVVATDVVVRDGLGQTIDGLYGSAAQVLDGANAQFRRAFFGHNRDVGALVSRGGARLVMEDSIVHDTLHRLSDRLLGGGVGAQRDAEAELRRVIIANHRSLGVLAHRGAISLTDVTVRDTTGNATDGAEGRGINAQLGSRVDLTRVLVERSTEIGVLATHETYLTATDLVVRDTTGQQGDGHAGRGISVQADSSAELSRVRIERSREIGLLFELSATAAVSDLLVWDTAVRRCGETTCPENSFGIGVGVYGESSVLMNDFSVARAALCGVQLDRGGQLDLVRGEVIESPIGICVQGDAYDFGRLTGDVRYFDNGTNLDATTLPVPEASSTIEL